MAQGRHEADAQGRGQGSANEFERDLAGVEDCTRSDASGSIFFRRETQQRLRVKRRTAVFFRADALISGTRLSSAGTYRRQRTNQPTNRPAAGNATDTEAGVECTRERTNGNHSRKSVELRLRSGTIL
ncbi:uncharacterized protein LOC117205564 [Bombus bifarius]|uniref:Uncharacterized protein LOC117205564 n=1 Tax=Bombus bifarius TaxID=103933 RepID=A0A6P8MBI9_9HYME|nr:uncharacterized protein LOC117155336 [Bombus vancouverensis nearcticus]XP_033299990.1 uncharacterized protein LOC117205564 [Bombus bifarius]